MSLGDSLSSQLPSGTENVWPCAQVTGKRSDIVTIRKPPTQDGFQGEAGPLHSSEATESEGKSHRHIPLSIPKGHSGAQGYRGRSLHT